MNFLHPQFLWLVPLVTAPIIIHLLSRLRYRRVRWAAIDFLLSQQRRTVRRAKLQQILLMLLRTLALAAALMALAAPVFRGGIARLLGARGQLIALLDTSASMAASGAEGEAFERGRTLIDNTLKTLPGATRAAIGFAGHHPDIPYTQPIQDTQVLRENLRLATRTSSAGNIPAALTAAAQFLQAHAGSGGTIWLITDGQITDWRTTDSGAWHTAQQALTAAGKPRLVLTALPVPTGANCSIAGATLHPPVATEGDTPRLTLSIETAGQPTNETFNIQLYYDGRLVDAPTLQFTENTRKDVVLRLPTLEKGRHGGYVQLAVADALPADNRYYFALETGTRLNVTIIDGAPAADRFLAASGYLSLALDPPSATAVHSPIAVTIAKLEQLQTLPLENTAALILADLPALTPAAQQHIETYVQQGGLLIVFPGRTTRPADWQSHTFPPLNLGSLIQLPPDTHYPVTIVQRNNPLIDAMDAEGLLMWRVQQLYDLTPAGKQTTLLETAGHPILVRADIGRGRLYAFTVSAQEQFSNLPYIPAFLPLLHRMILTHALDTGARLAISANDRTRISLAGAGAQLVAPDGALIAVQPLQDDPTHAVLDQTAHAGLYRAAPTAEAPGQTGPVIAAVNVPPEETLLERITETNIRQLLPGQPITFYSEQGQPPATSQETAAFAVEFPLAALAWLALIASAILAWHMDRPRQPKDQESAHE